MAYDAEFHDGFDTLGPTGRVLIDNDVVAEDCLLFAGEWAGIWKTSGTGSSVNASVAEPLGELGQALRISASTSTTGAAGITRTLPDSYGRVVGGANIQVPTFHTSHLAGFAFGDGDSDQVCIAINGSGQIEVRRASGTASAFGGTLLGTSTASVSAGQNVSLAWDVTPADSGGKVKVWLNDHVVLDITGADTQNTASATISTFRAMLSVFFASSVTHEMVIDDVYLWMFSAAGGADIPGHNLVVETQFPESDESVDFAFGAAVLGADHSVGVDTDAPGANRLWLRRYTPEASGTLDSVGMIPGAASAGAKFKAVAYADSAGAPGALWSDGTEVVGAVAGERLVSDLVTPHAIVKGTALWIGFIGDTSVALELAADDTTEGYGAANTYTSGAPGTAPTMTPNQASWVIYGAVSGVSADFWSVLNNNPPSGDRNYLTSSTATDRDMYGFPILSTTPTAIYSLAVKMVVRRSDAGARTMNLLTTSGATTDSGDNAGQTPSTSYGTLASYWSLDPDSAAAWNASGVNLAKHGYEIAT